MEFRLKDFRETQKKFQSDMATILGVNQSNVSRMELKGVSSISYPQYKALCETFGKEAVDEFIVKENEQAVVVANNKNEGSGTQDNSVNVGNADAMTIIHTQAKALSDAIKKQSEQADRMMTLLEKLTEKLS